MSIEKLLEQHGALVDEADRAAKFGAVTAADVSRPVELQEQRIAAVKQRIEALEASKQDYVKRTDEAIQGLKEDLAGLEGRTKADREALAPVLDAVRNQRGTTDADTKPHKDSEGQG